MGSVTVSTKDISELRARTGAGIGDCKKALEEAGGDLEKAAEILRKKGIAKADKRAGRVASQGLVAVELGANGTAGAMIELDCETDFVARTDDFKGAARTLAQHAAQAAPVGVTNVETDAAYGALPLSGQTVSEVVKGLSARTGEAVTLRRAARFAPQGGVVGHYLHHNQQVGVLVELAGATGPDALQLAKDIAMHVSHADPVAVTPADIPADLLERERRIAEEQVAAEGKPENIRGKIVEGKVRKFAAERALVEQAFVRDESKTVGQLLAAVAGAKVVRFARFKVGEA